MPMRYALCDDIYALCDGKGCLHRPHRLPYDHQAVCMYVYQREAVNADPSCKCVHAPRLHDRSAVLRRVCGLSCGQLARKLAAGPLAFSFTLRLLTVRTHVFTPRIYAGILFINTCSLHIFHCSPLPPQM